MREVDVQDAARRPSSAIRILLVAAGLGLAPPSLPAQQVDFDRLWSHDTGG